MENICKAKRKDKNPFADRQSTKERVADATTTVQRLGDETGAYTLDGSTPERGSFYSDEEIEGTDSQKYSKSTLYFFPKVLCTVAFFSFIFLQKIFWSGH